MAALPKSPNYSLAIVIGLAFVGRCAFGQAPSLNLSSGSAVKGSSVSLNLSLSAGSAAPSSLQWTIGYPTADITSVSVSAGSALTAAGKTITCNPGGGSLICLAAGINQTAIGSGVVAVVTANISPSSAATSDSLSLTGVFGALPDGTNANVTGTGGIISFSQTVSALQCTSASLASGASATCTVSTSSPAPAGGMVVTISDNSPSLTVPASVTIAAGATSASFQATAKTISTAGSATITATYNGVSASTTVSLSPSAASAPVSGGPVSDDFNATTLNTGLWTFVNPFSDGSVQLTGTNLLLTAPARTTHDLWAGGDNAVRVMQTIANVDFEVAVKFDTVLSSPTTMQGVVVEQDAADFLRFEFLNLGAGAVHLFSASIMNNSPTILVDQPISVSSPLWIKIKRAANTWTISWSSDGNTYKNASSFTQALTVARIGPYAANEVSGSSAAPAFTASIDYFLNTASPSAAASSSTSAVTTVNVSPASDDFHAQALNTSLWTFVNPQSDGAYQMTGSNLLLSVPTGANHDLWVGGNHSIRVTQPAVNGNFQLEAKFESAVTQQYQIQGILVEQDVNNYLRFDVLSDGTTPHIFSAAIIGGNPTSEISRPISSGGAPFYIRVQRSGNTWTQLWSIDGVNYNNAGTYTQQLAVARVGVYGGNSSPSPAFIASVDYFLNLASPISAEDGGSVGITLLRVTPTVGGGTVAWTTDRGASSQVNYGLTSSYGNSTKLDNTQVTSHSATLSGLTCGSTYHYSVTSSVSGNSLSSPDATFVPLCSASGQSTAHDIRSGESGTTVRGLSALSCMPKVVAAGGQATCELRVTATPTPADVQIATNSQNVKVPMTVAPRANQARVTFLASTDTSSAQQLVAIHAALDGETVQDTIQVQAGSQPIIIAPGDQSGKPGSPLRFAVSAADPSQQPVTLSARSLPAGAVFDSATGRFEWTPAATQNGTYQVQFTATNPLGHSSAAQVKIDVTSGQPALAAAQSSCSPGAIGSLAGSWLTAQGESFSDPSGNAMELGGTKVRVNGETAPVLSASSSEVRFLCPSLPAGTLQIAVETQSGTSSSAMSMESVWPRIFTLGAVGQGQAIVSFRGTSDLALARNFRVPAHPAQAGDELLIWATGLGLTSATNAGQISVTMGGANAEVEAVQTVPGYAGVYTIQVRVPAAVDFGDDVPLQLWAASADSKAVASNIATLSVEAAQQ